MDEVIVEGLNYEDFVALKKILTECTIFSATQTEEMANNSVLLHKIEEIIRVFDE
jgi:hypothetical protein|tara:strand:+ start:121 stop:285 length:165 start_codon:yes stop_codon:yes gene_type:complete